MEILIEATNDTRVLTLGDAAFTIEYSGFNGDVGARKIQQIYEKIKSHDHDEKFSAINNLIPAIRSLTVSFDPLKGSVKDLSDKIIEISNLINEETVANSIFWQMPACYMGKYGLDLENIAKAAKLTIEEVISLHATPIYDILAIGFLPGFPFMAKLPDQLQIPRKKTPRLNVAAGSVAIANGQTSIYPWQSPGGWNLLARCPVPLFNPALSKPSLLSAGDKVKFNPVNIDDYLNIYADLKTNKISSEYFISK